jgi:hypothetical protein
MSLLLFFLFGAFITNGEADKCCKFYVPPPSTVLVQLKNHNIIGAVPRQSPPSHYSSHLLPPQSTAPPNNYFLLNYHANINPNTVYHTPPPQNYMQNGLYGYNQGSYAAPAWQQTYYQTPGYLPATIVPPASYAIQQNETKKQANYYVSSAFFANSTEVNENNLEQSNNPIISQHQLGDHLRNAENSTTTQIYIVKDEDENAEDAFLINQKVMTYMQSHTSSPISTSPYQSSQPTTVSTNYQENVRDLNNAENKKQQPTKTSSTSFTPTTSNSETLFPQAILLPNGTLSRNNTGVGTQQQESKNANIAQKINTTPSKSSFSNTQSLLQTTTTAVNTIRTQNSQKSVKTTPTISVSEVTHGNYNTNQQPNISSKAILSTSTKITSLEPTSTLVTTTVFIPGHRDAQKYGNNPYEENSVQNFKAINIILLLSVIAHILANVR